MATANARIGGLDKDTMRALTKLGVPLVSVSSSQHDRDLCRRRWRPSGPGFFGRDLPGVGRLLDGARHRLHDRVPRRLSGRQYFGAADLGEGRCRRRDRHGGPRLRDGSQVREQRRQCAAVKPLFAGDLPNGRPTQARRRGQHQHFNRRGPDVHMGPGLPGDLAKGSGATARQRPSGLSWILAWSDIRPLLLKALSFELYSIRMYYWAARSTCRAKLSSLANGMWNVYNIAHSLESETVGGKWLTEISGSFLGQPLPVVED